MSERRSNIRLILRTKVTRIICTLRDRLRGNRSDIAWERHAREAIKWIFRAQDAPPDRGVSHGYNIGKGWLPSYPETTGYIIPTLLNWSTLKDDFEAERRALDMADWVCEIQYTDGSVTGGVVGSNVGPVVFNTGQAIFGWLAAYNRTGDDKYLNSAVRAGNWLMSRLDNGGKWSTHGSMGVDRKYVYNVRVAWAILELWKSTGRRDYIEAMSDFVSWVLEKEETPGWFSLNCLNFPESPLLHTIAYTAQGLLESGIILQRNDAVAAAMRTADALIHVIKHDGWMAGRFNSEWQQRANWACLTGIAQMGIVWSRLGIIKGNDKYYQAASRVNGFLKRKQDLDSRNPGLLGGIRGSYPTHGGYMTYHIPNWATKFFLDSLILQNAPKLSSLQNYCPG